MNGEPEVTKDLVFERPTEVSTYNKDKRVPRDWTVAEVEETMWRIRAAGGTDSTPLPGLREIRAAHVEAFAYDAPRRTVEPLAELKPAPWWGPIAATPGRAAAEILGLLVLVLFVLPLVIKAALVVWGLLL